VAGWSGRRGITGSCWRSHLTREVKQACAELVDDPEYRRNLATRLRGGTLSPAVECMLWYYAKGKPKDEVEAAQKVVFTWARPDWYTKEP
jgi:hypothetical protein